MNTLIECCDPASHAPATIHGTSFPGIMPTVPEWETGNKFQTTELKNPNRLQEIYMLRLTAWEGSARNEIANKILFPNGWYDDLDESAIHWVTVDGYGTIVASARLNIFDSPQASPYFSATHHLVLPSKSTFAFFSRLVVHPKYRKMGLGRALYEARAEFCRKKKIAWSQVFINDPCVIKMFETEGFRNLGQALVSYHPSAAPHAVNVLVVCHPNHHPI